MRTALATLALTLTLALSPGAYAKAPASAVDKATYVRYAWEVARALSGLPEALLDTAQPPELHLYNELLLRPGMDRWLLYCGFTRAEYRGLPDGSVTLRYIVNVYALESDALYTTLIHEFLHVIGLQLTDDGSEAWVRERFPADCEWPQ